MDTITNAPKTEQGVPETPTQGPTIHVRNKHSRYHFDGQTGILILNGTRGTVGAMTLDKSPHKLPTLTIFWDAVVVQDRENNEPSTYDGWEESGVQPDAIIVEGVPQ